MPKEEKYKKIALLVIDGFGIGAMDDVKDIRKADINSNTAYNVLTKSGYDFPTLRKLGLYDLINQENNDIPFICTSSNLKHFGADSYYGHQEIMGTKPLKPKLEGFYKYIDVIEKELKKNNISYEYANENPKLLLVNKTFTLGDNIETDFGQAYNITADLNKMEFEEVVKIAKIIRKVIKVPRLIVFGSKDTSVNKILNAIEVHDDKYVGVNAPNSGVYTNTYQCVHLGYGVDFTKQCANKLFQNGYGVSLIGKAADVIIANGARYLPMVDTKNVMDLFFEQIQEEDVNFIFANVQETDLAGHSEDVKKFGQKLKIVDDKLEHIIQNMCDDTLLIIMADHGDDPCIKHSQHTREKVPILIYSKNNKQKKILPIRDTMADVGQSIYNILTDQKLEYGEVIKW